MTGDTEPEGLADLDGRLEGLRRKVAAQGRRGQDLRRAHREQAAASDERRDAVLDRIARTREERYRT